MRLTSILPPHLALPIDTVLSPRLRSPRYGFIALLLNVLLIIATAGTAAWVIHAEGLEACSTSLASTVYPHLGLLVKPYTRAIPYLLGFILAYWVNAMGGEEGITNISKPSLIRRLALGAVSATLLLAALFGGIDMRYEPPVPFFLVPFLPLACLGQC